MNAHLKLLEAKMLTINEYAYNTYFSFVRDHCRNAPRRGVDPVWCKDCHLFTGHCVHPDNPGNRRQNKIKSYVAKN